MANFNERFVVTVLRWTARILSLAPAASNVFHVALWAVVGQSQSPFTTSLQHNLIVLAMWTTTVGLLVGWKWEGIGGLLTLGGVALSSILFYNFSDLTESVVGLLYLVCWWRNSARLTREDSQHILGVGIRVLKHIWLPLVLVAAHAVLFAVIAAQIALGSGVETGMIWSAFHHFDYPISLSIRLLPRSFLSNERIAWTILALGTIQWGIIGLVVQGAGCLVGRIVKRLRKC